MILKNASILIIDDDPDILVAMKMLLKSIVKEVVTEKNPNLILSTIQQKKFDAIILDMNFNNVVNLGNEGIYWLHKIKEIDKDVGVILITAYGSMDLAIRSLKEGAQDFLVKPWENEKFIQSIREILLNKKSDKSKRWNPQLNGGKIIGKSEIMKDVFHKIKKIAPTDANILILGENGTGKDLIAQAMHDHSLRKDKPFIKIDVGALTPSLFESELFGYKKGAFTGADKDRKGRFESANGGTLFIDEIGNINLQQQASLLTVLQNRHITPLGSNTPIPLDIRLICATNLGIECLSDENKFRKDLIYRINTVEVIIPPLRQRKKDIELLAEYFIDMYVEKYHKTNLSVNKLFIEKLCKYDFPGNVRELQYTLERAVIMVEGNTLNENDLVFSPIERPKATIDPVDQSLETIEKNAILKVLQKYNGNVSKSAKILGITRTALYRRLHKYGI